MYAIVDIAGEQFKVEKNAQIVAPRLTGEIGDKLEFENVLLVAKEKDTQIGKPFLEGAKVQATIMAHDKAKKVLIFKKKRRKGYRLFRGHRQQQTRLKIDDIIA